MSASLDKNIDSRVVKGFGQGSLARAQRETIFRGLLSDFPWGLLPPGGGDGADIRCGTGRWGMMVAPRAAHLHLVDVSPNALAVARENLAHYRNVSFHEASIADIPLPDARSICFLAGRAAPRAGHPAAIDAIAGKLKSGALFLIYLYYAFDNRPVGIARFGKAATWCA
jgi:SAM-dependent methyltransferase